MALIRRENKRDLTVFLSKTDSKARVGNLEKTAFQVRQLTIFSLSRLASFGNVERL